MSNKKNERKSSRINVERKSEVMLPTKDVQLMYTPQQQTTLEVPSARLLL